MARSEKIKIGSIIAGVFAALGLAWAVQGSINTSLSNEIEQTQTDLRDHRITAAERQFEIIEQLTERRVTQEYIAKRVDAIYEKLKDD